MHKFTWKAQNLHWTKTSTVQLRPTIKQYRALNTAISVTCSLQCLIIWVSWHEMQRLDAHCSSGDHVLSSKNTFSSWRIVLLGGLSAKTAANFYDSFSSWRDRSICSIPSCSVVSLNCFCYKTYKNTQLLLRVCSEWLVIISNYSANNQN